MTLQNFVLALKIIQQTSAFSEMMGYFTNRVKIRVERLVTSALLACTTFSRLTSFLKSPFPKTSTRVRNWFSCSISTASSSLQSVGKNLTKTVRVSTLFSVFSSTPAYIVGEISGRCKSVLKKFHGLKYELIHVHYT